MAATATSRARAPSSKTAPSRKGARRDPDEAVGPKLQVRYFKRMKPHRVYSLVVEVPKSKRRDEDEKERGSVVVVRPIIAGAQVQPAEQRFEAAPGNQIIFYVTPLARGRLPRARLEVFAPNQPPEVIGLKMKAKTQRLALLL